jgi:hypothetical protein
VKRERVKREKERVKREDILSEETREDTNGEREENC